MLFRIQPLFSLFLRRIPIFQSRISASSNAPRSDEDWKDDQNTKDKTENETHDDEANISSMIGPYVSSKQVAFHTGQFDSEHIKKKNKQAFLVWIFLINFIEETLCVSIRMSLKHIKFNFQIVVVMWNLSELHFDV